MQCLPTPVSQLDMHTYMDTHVSIGLGLLAVGVFLMAWVMMAGWGAGDWAGCLSLLCAGRDKMLKGS